MMPMREIKVATVMQTLADPTRRGIYERIVRAGETTVAELARTSAVSQPAISQHMKSLREAGLVGHRRSGRNTHYRADPRGLEPLVDWIGIYGEFWRGRFARLKELLKEIDS
jgi:DNA-binding transcriptional ArsR family regulator